MARNYDERLNQAMRSVKKDKFTLYDKERCLSLGDTDRQGNKVIFEAVD
jgi:hypothetical protein